MHIDYGIIKVDLILFVFIIITIIKKIYKEMERLYIWIML